MSSASIKVIQSVVAASKALCRANPGPVFFSHLRIVISNSGNLCFTKL